MLPQHRGITLAGFLIRWVTVGKNSDGNCLSPEAKATAGQTAQKVANSDFQAAEIKF